MNALSWLKSGVLGRTAPSGPARTSRAEPLERYVQAATRGLYGKKRVQVARELRGNILARAAELQAFGESEARALERALHEFGSSTVLARGMREVHVMPMVFKSGALGLLGLGAGLALWSSSSAAVQSLSQIPAQVCATSKDRARCELDRQFPSSWLEVGSLVRELRDQGVRVERTTLDEEALILHFPSNAITNIPLRTERFYLSEGTYFRLGTKEYINTSLLLQALDSNSIPFSIDDPSYRKLSIGKITLTLSDKSGGFDRALLQSLNGYIAGQFSLRLEFERAGLECCAPRLPARSSGDAPARFWSIQAPANASYLVLRLADKVGGGKMALADLARADAAGKLSIPRHPLEQRFVGSLEALSKSRWGEALMLVRLEWGKSDYFDLANVLVPPRAEVERNG